LEGKGDLGEIAGASPQPKSEIGELQPNPKFKKRAFLVREFCTIMQDLLAA
jgi:hypothetical protein